GALPALRALVEPLHSSSRLAALAAHLTPDPAAATLLQRAIAQEPAVAVRDGGVIAAGFDAELDELRGLAADGGDYLLQLETDRGALPALRALVEPLHSSSRLAALAAHLTPDPAAATLLQRAIAQEPAVAVRDGGVIAAGFDAELDELRGLAADGGDYLLQLE